MMKMETQTEVGVGIEALWKALARDMRFIIPKIIPNLVKSVEVIEGDGGLGTILLFNFGSDVPTMRYQKEKIVELDESLHQIGLQVVEGGHLHLGFASYKTTFQLTAISERETRADVKVVYETETEEISMPADTTKSALAFIKSLENYLLKGVS